QPGPVPSRHGRHRPGAVARQPRGRAAPADVGRPPGRAGLYARVRRGRSRDSRMGLARTVTVLVVNAGSSSLKLRLLGDDDVVLESADLPPDGSVVDAMAGWPAPDVVGHRIVHGGTDFAGPVLVDADVRKRLAQLTDLAPLHQPKSLAAL